MKDIVTYINEVSKGLVQRAYNKATGAQKNRIKKLYKEIYDDDVTKSDISHIDFEIEATYEYEQEQMIKRGFKQWPQDMLDKIDKVYVEVSDDDEDELEYTIYINDNGPWRCSWKLKNNSDDFYFYNSNFISKKKAGNYPNVELIIAYIYEYAKKHNIRF